MTRVLLILLTSLFLAAANECGYGKPGCLVARFHDCSKKQQHKGKHHCRFCRKKF